MTSCQILILDVFVNIQAVPISNSVKGRTDVRGVRNDLEVWENISGIESIISYAIYSA